MYDQTLKDGTPYCPNCWQEFEPTKAESHLNIEKTAYSCTVQHEPPREERSGDFSATYSPEDNKLRLYAVSRLPEDLYKEVRAHGFIWAPKQELFVAPMWTPSREDFLLTLVDEIEDEDKSLVERAEERSDRFEDYSEKRANDADRAHEYVDSIAGGIPMGQPILVGHHSERHARRDAERIENGMRRAVKMWETSQYWISRAKGALQHAKYKELPTVRARRIKGIEADKRKRERSKRESERCIALWTNPEKELTHERARGIANYDHLSMCFTLEKYPRKSGASNYEGSMGFWSALGDTEDTGIISPEQARDLAVYSYRCTIARAERWITHYENRLAYETTMLDAQGASDLLKPKARPALLPICNYRADSITCPNRWSRGDFITYSQVEMTSKEYARIHTDYKSTSVCENSHRIRTAMSHSVGIQNAHGRLVAVFLTDSKVHPKPSAIEPGPPQPRKVFESTYKAPTPNPEAAPFEAMRESLKAGVQVVSAPQLFPTPRELAERMIEEADIQPGQRILEPSAGTGMLLGAMGGRMFCEPSETPYKDRDQLYAVEINTKLATRLEVEFPLTKIICGDFLEQNGNLGKFDRIVMNPPFVNGVMPDADYQDFVYAMERFCHCDYDRPCDGVLAGGPCDGRKEQIDEYDEDDQ